MHEMIVNLKLPYMLINSVFKINYRRWAALIISHFSSCGSLIQSSLFLIIALTV